jgi:hypothetical protein
MSDANYSPVARNLRAGSPVPGRPLIGAGLGLAASMLVLGAALLIARTIYPRLNTQGTLSLEELTGNATVPLPMPAGILPLWLDPTETTQFALAVSADQPVNIDMNYNSGEPELYAPAAGNPTVDKVTAAQVSPGIWTTNIGQNGPFSGPAPAGTAQLSATAVGSLFDPNASSTTGDIWTAGVSGQSAALSPAVVMEIRPTRGTPPSSCTAAGSRWPTAAA